MPHHLHLRTTRFPILDDEDAELVNPGTYGKALAEYLKAELGKLGYDCPFVVCEDWGWWVSVSLRDKKIGLACYREHDQNRMCDFALSVSQENPRVWSWKKFRFVDISAQLDKLATDLKNVFERDPKIEFISLSSEFPDIQFFRNGEDYPR